MFPFRRVCTIQAAAGVIWGLLLLVAPSLVLDTLLGMQNEPSGLLVGRFAGGMLFALGVVLSACRDVEDDALRARIALGNAAVDLAVVGVLATGLYTGLTSGFIGGMVCVFFAFSTLSWVATRFS